MPLKPLGKIRCPMLRYFGTRKVVGFTSVRKMRRLQFGGRFLESAHQSISAGLRQFVAGLSWVRSIPTLTPVRKDGILDPASRTRIRLTDSESPVSSVLMTGFMLQVPVLAAEDSKAFSDIPPKVIGQD
jgi:hypothetical protein